MSIKVLVKVMFFQSKRNPTKHAINFEVLLPHSIFTLQYIFEVVI